MTLRWRQMGDAMERGSYEFEAGDSGGLLNTASNVELLRELWLDRDNINGDDIGPGDPGDFDNGAWHVACHLLGGGGVRKLATASSPGSRSRMTSAERPYFASATVREGQARAPCRSIRRRDAHCLQIESLSVSSRELRSAGCPPASPGSAVAVQSVAPAGFRPAAGQRRRTAAAFGSTGARCATSGPTHAIGTSVLTAYVSLVAALGDLFIPCVARGRREYGHPVQLRAMVARRPGRSASATWDGKPTAISKEAEKLFQEADEAAALKAVEQLKWSAPPQYYMFARKISGWSKAEEVQADISDI